MSTETETTEEVTPGKKAKKKKSQPVHVPLDAVAAARKEAKRRGTNLGDEVGHLIEYALKRKAALKKYADS